MVILKKEKGSLVFSVSKWLKQQVLLDDQELRGLFAHLMHFTIYNMGSILPFEELEIPVEAYIEAYAQYIHQLKEGKYTPLSQKMAASALTADDTAIYAEEIQKDRWMAKLAAPLVQVQRHQFYLSKVDHQIHPMVMSQEAVSWGVQLAFPQILFDAKKGTYQNVWKDQDFLNKQLYAQLLKWVRHHSLPVTFFYQNHKIATPIRLGKNCFCWIQNHPQLKEHQLTVHQSEKSF